MAAGFAEAACLDGTAFATALRTGGVAFELRAGVFGSFALALFGGAALLATERFGVPSALDAGLFEAPFDADFVAAGAGLVFPAEFALLARPSCERVAFEACALDADFVSADFLTAGFTGGLATALDGPLETVLFVEAAFATDLPSRFTEFFGSVCSLPGDFRGGGTSVTALLAFAGSTWLFGDLLAEETAVAFARVLATLSFFRVASALTASDAEFPAVGVGVRRGIS